MAEPFNVKTDRRQGPLVIPFEQHAERLREPTASALPFLQVYDVPIERIYFWPDNHNQMDEATFRGECESILMYDFVDPTLVRPFDETDLAAGIGAEGYVEMIDGEHRTRAVATWIEQGFPQGVKIPPGLATLVKTVSVPAFIMPMSRLWASRIRLAISELHGKKDYKRLGALVTKISEEVPLEELRLGTPWTVAEVQEMISVGRFDWASYEKDHQGGDKGKPDDSGMIKVTLEVPKGQRDKVFADLTELQARSGVRFKEKTSRGKK